MLLLNFSNFLIACLILHFVQLALAALRRSNEVHKIVDFERLSSIPEATFELNLFVFSSDEKKKQKKI